MTGGGDDNKEADDLTDLLTALLEGALSPEVGDSLEVLDKLLAVAEDVAGLTSDNLEDLTSLDFGNKFSDGLLKSSKTASLEGLGDGLDGISKLKKSTLDGLDADLLDTSLKIRPGSVHISDDDIDVTSTARGITHAVAQALSNTTDQLVNVSGGGRDIDLSVVLIDEDAKDFTNILTSLVEVLGLPLSANVLEQVDELTTMGPDVHNLVLDEGLDLTRLDLSDDLDDGLSHLLKTTSLESISKLLNTISKGKETLHDSLNIKSLDTVRNQLNSIIEITSHVLDVPDTGGGITHDNIKTNSNTLKESKNILLALDAAILLKLLSRSNDETRLIDCTGRDHQSKKNKSIRTHCF